MVEEGIAYDVNAVAVEWKNVKKVNNMLFNNINLPAKGQETLRIMKVKSVPVLTEDGDPIIEDTGETRVVSYPMHRHNTIDIQLLL